MNSYPYTQFTTSRNFVYSYIHIRPSQADAKYILFLHGFPSSSYDWRHQIPYFQQKGYGMIVPDMLGYGGTSKPLHTKAYSGKSMAQDIYEILEHEKIDSALGVGHDWGSFALSRLANFYPTLMEKLVFVDVGYNAPGWALTEQNIRYVNSMVQQAMGYSVFGYFLFFNEGGAAALMDHQPDSVQSLFHSKDEEQVKKYMGAEGGFRTWVAESMVAETPRYLSEEDIEYHRQLFAAEKGGYGPPINWYQAQFQGINSVDENELSKENHMLNQPTLLVTSTNFITASADFPKQMQPFAPNLVCKELDAGHWIQLERPDELNHMLGDFFEG